MDTITLNNINNNSNSKGNFNITPTATTDTASLTGGWKSKEAGKRITTLMSADQENTRPEISVLHICKQKTTLLYHTVKAGYKNTR